MSSPKTSHDRAPRLTGRGRTVIALGSLAALAGLSEIGYSAAQGAVGAVKGVHSNFTQNGERAEFEHKLAANPMDSQAVVSGLRAEGVDPADVTLHTVHLGEGTPTEVAEDMHAKDTTFVAGEITAQVGGDRSLQVGDVVAVPNDQLDSPQAH